MKNTLLFISLIAITFSSCNRFKIHTELHEDGSITRSYSINGNFQNFENIMNDDSALTIKKPYTKAISFPENAFQLYPIDTTWKVYEIYDTTDNKTFIQYSHTYKNIEIIQNELLNKRYNLKPLKPEINYIIKKSWFKTEFLYLEKIQSKLRFDKSLSFFSDKEINDFNTFSSIIEDSILLTKFAVFMAYGTIDEIIAIINENSSNQYNLKDWQQIMYDSIANSASLLKINQESTREIFELLNLLPYDTLTLIQDINRITGYNIDTSLNKTIAEIISLKTDFSVFVPNKDYNYTLVFPGKLINSNADSISNNVAFWNYQYIATKDTIFQIQSYIINTWPLLFTILVIILVIIFVIYKIRTR